MAIDLVCGMEVDEKTAKFISEYKDNKYYFCAPGCKHLFDKEPEAYMGPDRKPYVPMDEVPQE